MSESSREHDPIELGQVCLSMPYQLCLTAQGGQGMDYVMLTVGSGEDDYRRPQLATTTEKSSSTGFARS
jgi:hypothetical protein